MNESKNKFIFFGSPRFAEIFLSSLTAVYGFQPQEVVVNPDKIAGRKKILTAPLVKKLAEQLHIPVRQPQNLKNEVFKESVYGIVAAYGGIIPEKIIKQFPKGIIGIHPSLLPHYRGPSPIQQAILDGKRETGVTLFLIDKYVDHGPIIAQRKVPIEANDTYTSLEEKLAIESAKLFSEIIEQYIKEELIPQKQNEAEATFTKKIVRDDAFIAEKDLNNAMKGEETEKVAAKIKALNPEPGTWTLRKGKEMKILECEINDGKLILTKIQFAGKTPQAVRESFSDN